MEASAIIGDEAIEASGLAVFRQVENPGTWVDCDGFVHEAAKRLERHGFYRNVKLAWNFKDIAMLFGKATKWSIRGLTKRCAEDRFLAREPAAPRRRAARTVCMRPGEANKVAL